MDELEVGWLIVGELDRVDREAVLSARERVEAEMCSRWPEFRWVMPVVEQPGVPTSPRREPTELLELGVMERDSRGWDFVLVLTSSDLIGHSKDSAFATPSRALGVGAISTSRIDPQAEGREFDQEQRREVMAQRVFALALHVLGRLGGLEHVHIPGAVMCPVASLDQLDRVERFSEASVRELQELLQEVADLRLEEEPPNRRSVIRFFVYACWLNARVIIDAVVRAKPWRFPFRLSKLTTAAVSTLVVLMVTAEVWDLALTRSGTFLLGMSAVVWLVATAYVIARQRLILGSHHHRLTEQAVAGEVSVVVVVALGMLTTYAYLFVLASGVGLLLFSPALIDSWAQVAGLGGRLGYLRVGSFVSAAGLLIGALGASFEQRHYLHHVTYVDEEI